MPTAKKSTAKKPTAKKPATKRAPAKAKAATKTTRVSTAQATAAPIRSFRRHRATSEAFFTFRITHQTLYWTILAGIVLLLGIWVTSISMKVQHIYDQIDATNASAIATPERHQSVPQ